MLTYELNPSIYTNNIVQYLQRCHGPALSRLRHGDSLSSMFSKIFFSLFIYA